MESKYKEILLLTGLDNITDEELDRFKFFLPDELKVSTAKLENANRTEVANLMIQNVGAVSAVTKTIHVFQKLNYMHVAKSLQEEKEKGFVPKKQAHNRQKQNVFMYLYSCTYISEVDKKYKGKKGTQQVKKRSQTEMSPGASAAPRNSVVEQHIAPEVSPHVKPKQKQMVAKQEPIRKEGLQKGSMTVMVLKATKPFEFETKEGKQEMFHATVATESEFFFVKVFNKKLKDKFTPKNIIIISKYYWYSHFLEVNSVSHVSDAKSDQQISVPKHIIRKAGETPKINKLQTQPRGTIVNGVFVIQKMLVLFCRKQNGGIVNYLT
nr:interferon-inducible protein AIM2 isoform X4 [Equus asinus]